MADQNIKVKIDLDVAEFKKHAEELSKAISNVLGKDVELFNGKIKQTSGYVDQAAKSFNNAANAAKNAGNYVKNSNQQWTNLSLVIQDLPFGFRAIQNNLPALAAGFAAVTGPIYLAVSALIAIWTSFGDEITKVIFKTSDASKNNKLLSDTFKGVENSVVQASTSVDKMNFMIDQAKKGFVDKDKVVKVYNETLGKTIGQQENFNGVVAAMDSKAAKYIELVTMMSFANALAAQSAKEAFTALMAEVKAPEEALGSIQKFGKNALSSVEYLISSIRGKTSNMTSISDALYGAVGTVEKGKEVSAANKSKKFLDEFLGNVKKEISKFAQENNFNIFDFGDDGGAKKVEDNSIDVLKAQQQYYKDNILMFNAYEQEILKKEEALAIKQAQIEGKKGDYIQNIIDKYEQLRINSAKNANDKILEQNTKAGIQEAEERQKINDLIMKGKEDIASALAKINSEMNKENIKNANDELGVNLKAVGRNYRAQKEAYEMTIAKLKEKKAALDATGVSTTEYADAIANLENRMSGLVDPLETLSQSLQTIFDNLKIDLLVGFGEALGEALSGGEFDLTALATILADALSSIGKALISYAVLSGAAMETLKDPTKWPVALAAGIAAIAAGAALKSKIKEQKTAKFANGGIVSGPTMGLVGEYPGAKSNPEVIAPLDKLKSMINGGGGGTFVLRGQDLLLATNRAQKASNLKGQNISLA
jgi:hypothetical protein